jgi:Calcineurin-like phosphoesterase
MNWTKQECIDALKDLSELYPDVIITRDFFRQNSDCPEYWWTRYFGTFSEFKQNSGLSRTREQNKLLNQVAKHASKDSLRKLNEEKANYSEKYLRPDTKKFQTIVTITDTHDISLDPFTRRVYLDTLKRIQPEVIVFGGDNFDLPEFSKYFNDPRNYNLIERITCVHDFLREIREIVPDAEFNWVAGNHEARLVKYLSEASPNIMVLLSDLHGFTVSKLLGLDEFEINYISREDLTAFTETDLKKQIGKNYLVKFDSILFHHYPDGKNYGLPGVNGHHHAHRCETLHNLNFGAYEWHQLGSGHIRRANYCEAQRWSTGFMISHHDIYNRTTVFEYVDTTKDFTIVGGKWYTRNEEELYKL